MNSIQEFESMGIWRCIKLTAKFGMCLLVAYLCFILLMFGIGMLVGISMGLGA
jgi:hypothetical protein